MKINTKKARKFSKSEIMFRKIVVAIMIAVTVVMGITGLIITGTQVKMFDYYISIRTAEDARDAKNAEVENQIAAGYPSGRIQYTQSQADEYDAEAGRLSAERMELKNSWFPIVRWAAKDCFEVSTVAIGIGIFLAIAAMWVVAIKWTKKYFMVVGVILKPIFWLIRMMFFGAFSLLAIIFFLFGKGFRNLANATKPSKVFPECYENSYSDSTEAESNIVPYYGKCCNI